MAARDSSSLPAEARGWIRTVRTASRQHAPPDADTVVCVSDRKRSPVGRVIGSLVTPVVDAVEVDDLLERIDVNALLERIDIERLIDRIDLEAVLDRIDVEALVDRIDVDRLVDRVDVGRIVNK